MWVTIAILIFLGLCHTLHDLSSTLGHPATRGSLLYIHNGGLDKPDHISVFEIKNAKTSLLGYEKCRKLTDEEKQHAYDAALFFAFLYWMDEQKEFGKRRIDWLAKHRNEFENIFAFT